MMVIKCLRFATVVVCGFFIVLMLYPTGSAADDVLEGYNNTLSSTSSEGIAWLYYKEPSPEEAKDPMLVDINTSVGPMCPYVFVDKNFQPISTEEPYTHQSDSFPQRLYSSFNVSKHGHADHVENTKSMGGHRGGHMGTDIYAKGPYYHGTYYNVALWSGTVCGVHTKADNSRGLWVVLDHGNNFYTRYQHLQTVTVKVGDRVQAGDVVGQVGGSGNTINMYGMHAHIELIIRPGPWNEVNFESWYYGGVANLIWLGKDLSDIKWYKQKWGGDLQVTVNDYMEAGAAGPIGGTAPDTSAEEGGTEP